MELVERMPCSSRVVTNDGPIEWSTNNESMICLHVMDTLSHGENYIFIKDVDHDEHHDFL